MTATCCSTSAHDRTGKSIHHRPTGCARSEARLTANGESIYGNAPGGGPWLPAGYGVSTHRGKYIYVHLLSMPKDGVLRLPILPISVVKAVRLHGPDLQFQQSGDSLSISLPAATENPIDTIVKLELEEAWTTEAVVPVP